VISQQGYYRVSRFVKYIRVVPLILIILSVSFFTQPISRAENHNITATLESEDSSYNTLVDTLNYETKYFYEDYYDFINLVDSIETESDYNSVVQAFSEKIPNWYAILEKNLDVYNRYGSSQYPNIVEIANLAADSNQQAMEGLMYYAGAFVESETAEEFEEYLSIGDEYISMAIDKHSEAIDLYNEYSGAGDAYNNAFWLIFFSVLSSLLSLVLFFKSKPNSKFDADIIRAGIYKSFFVSSLWMTIGLVVTTAGYCYSLKTGGEFYILYGAVLVGAWQLLKGVVRYFTKGRKILKDLAKQEKNEAIKSSYEEVDQIIEKTKVCPYCGSEQPANRVVCSECGNNLL
jgi:hypothetical protein